MSKVVFFNVPAHGHTNPTLALVKELVARGEEVIYYSFDEFKHKIEETGARYKPYNVDITGLANIDLTNFSLLYKTLMEGCRVVLDKLVIEMKRENPDYIIHDSLCCWAKYAAAILNIPAVASVTTFVLSNKSLIASRGFFAVLLQFTWFGIREYRQGYAIQKRLTRQHGLPCGGVIDAFMNKEALNIVYTSKDFQPSGHVFDDSYVFVGPSIMERKEKNDIALPASNPPPLVYVSLGTVVNTNLKFYDICFRALADMNLTVILSVGNKVDMLNFKNAPANFIVRNYVAQLDILSHADCFITHGGMNSVQEGLCRGVPLIVVPQQIEQQAVAERVADTRTGIYVRKVNVASLKEAVREILQNGTYKANCLTLGESLTSAGGFLRAADEIRLFMQKSGRRGDA